MSLRGRGRNAVRERLGWWALEIRMSRVNCRGSNKRRMPQFVTSSVFAGKTGRIQRLAKTDLPIAHQQLGLLHVGWLPWLGEGHHAGFGIDFPGLAGNEK